MIFTRNHSTSKDSKDSTVGPVPNDLDWPRSDKVIIKKPRLSNATELCGSNNKSKNRFASSSFQFSSEVVVEDENEIKKPLKKIIKFYHKT